VFLKMMKHMAGTRSNHYSQNETREDTSVYHTS
jgi:hypothetical protein